MADVIGRPELHEEQLSLQDAWNEAARYWEPRRLIYNGLLLSTVLFQITLGKNWHCLQNLVPWICLIVLAVAANFCYCSAYLLDLALQAGHYRQTWSENRFWIFGFGCALSVALATFALPMALQGLV